MRFSSDGGTFVASFGDDMSSNGTVDNFAQSYGKYATFVLHSLRGSGCDYNVTSYLEDGHLKGTYRGCGDDSGIFDLSSGIAGVAKQTSPTTADVAAALSTFGGRIAQKLPSVAAPESQSAPCIITGTVDWDASNRDAEYDDPADRQFIGAPLRGAHVTLTNANTTQDVQTDEHGTFKITAPVGSYTINVRASGYTSDSQAVTIEHPPSGSICLEWAVGLRSIGVDPHLTAAQKAKLARIDAAVARHNAAAAAVIASQNAIQSTYETAVNSYCKTATQAGCGFYTGRAGTCLGEAYHAQAVYQNLLGLEQSQGGLSSAQLVQQSSDPELASLAAAFIDRLNGNQKNAATDPRAPSVFARAILAICLKNIAR